MLTKEQIDQYLHEMDERLAAQGLTGEIILCGGAVMAYVYEARQSTKDIDALFAPTQALRKIASDMAKDHGLEPDWFNDAAKGFIDTSKMNFVDVSRMQALTVKRPDDEGMLAMKLASAREDSKDASDAVYLIRRLGIKQLDMLYDIMEKNIPKPRLTPISGFFAKEMLERAYAADVEEGKAKPVQTTRGECRYESLDDRIARVSQTNSYEPAGTYRKEEDRKQAR